MKISLIGALRLKPFDEHVDARCAGALYARSRILTALVLATALSALVALGMVFVGHPSSLLAIGVSVSISAITAGMEWHAGLHARALNQLFATVIAVGGISLMAPSWNAPL